MSTKQRERVLRDPRWLTELFSSTKFAWVWLAVRIYLGMQWLQADLGIWLPTDPVDLIFANASLQWVGGHETLLPRLFGALNPRGVLAVQMPANQDAPSWCYQAGSPCRNITCLNKYFKTCRTVRCFEHVDVGGLADLVTSHLEGLARQVRTA